MIKETKPRDLFGMFKEVTYLKSKWESFTIAEQKNYDVYLINTMLSFNTEYLPFVAAFQNLQLSSKEHYIFWCSLLPKKSIYNAWIKNTSKMQYPKLASFLKEKKYITTDEAHEYIDFCLKYESGLDFLKSLVGKFGFSEKQINEFFK
jgi:hypothetical protein